MKSIRPTCIALFLTMTIPGCGGPTGADRDNRRVLDSLLTAITLKNARLVEASAKRVTVIHDGGQITDDEFENLEAIIKTARDGNWPGAEQAAYAFRKQHPFVKEGQ